MINPRESYYRILMVMKIYKEKLIVLELKYNVIKILIHSIKNQLYMIIQAILLQSKEYLNLVNFI